jgi:hypothetical protein
MARYLKRFGAIQDENPGEAGLTQNELMNLNMRRFFVLE